jgi:hypothetical protein
MGTDQGVNWWKGVKGRVSGKQTLTRVAVRDQAATRLELSGLAPWEWHGPRMAAGGASAAALLAKKLARAEQEKRGDFNDPLFRQWQLDGPDPLERLRQSERGEDIGTREKYKQSGRARERDSTLEQGTRSKGQLQAGAHQLPGNDAAIAGGGSTSEGMHE